MSSAAEVVPEITPATRSIIYLGMDVHKEIITIAVLPQGAKSPARVDRLPNDLVKLKRFLERIARDGDVRACYEASAAGYVLHRAMEEWGTGKSSSPSPSSFARIVYIAVGCSAPRTFGVPLYVERGQGCRGDQDSRHSFTWMY